MLIWLGGILLAGNALVLPLIAVPRRLRELLVQRGISTIFRVFLASARACGLMRLDLQGLDNLNSQSGLLLVANHPSMIDVFLIISRVKQAVCIMKASIASNVFFGAGAYLGGYVSNRRTDAMLHQAVSALTQGRLLLAFPEGTRTTRQPINPIKPGAALIAKTAGVPLQTILITTNSAYLAKGWKIWRPPEFPLCYRVQLGVRLATSASGLHITRQLEHYYKHELSASINPQLSF